MRPAAAAAAATGLSAAASLRRRCAVVESAPLARSSVADAADVVKKSVVNIEVHTVSGRGIFTARAFSAGSGFIYNADGYVVTNAHVVSHAADKRVLVTLHDGRRVPAEVHSLDSVTDLALVRILPRQGSPPLPPPAALGRSSALRQGDFVVAVGSPLTLQNTVTFGIVSAVGRHGSQLFMGPMAEAPRTGFIQTDAAINVGNSGGPLVDLDGKVVGVNTMKLQGGENLNFAIPVDVARIVISQLLAHGRVTRPYLGLEAVTVQVDHPDAYRRAEHLVEVLKVRPGSPAERAGLRVGDVILEMDGERVRNTSDVHACVGMEVGRAIRLRVLRRGPPEGAGAGGEGGEEALPGHEVSLTVVSTAHVDPNHGGEGEG